jgi:hypothetical protein
MGAPARGARARLRAGRVVLALAVGLGAAGADAEEPAAAGAEEPAAAGPAEAAAEPAPDPQAPPAPEPVGLDRLLKLPAGSEYGSGERRGGRSRGQWAARFGGLRRALAQERRGLESAQQERDRIAGSADQWLLGPPGATRENAPLDFRLRQEIARHRDEIDRLEQDLRELEVEADLANVPPDWRE